MERLSFSEIGGVDLESKKCFQIHVYLFRVCFQLQPFQNRFACHKRALQDMLSVWGLIQNYLDNLFDQSIFWSLPVLDRRHIWESTTSILCHNWRNCTPLSDRKVSGTPPLSLPLCIRSHRRCFWGQSLCSGTIHLEHWLSILHTGGSCWYPQMFGFARRRSHCKLVLVSPPYNPTWSCPWRQTETGKPWSCLFWSTSRGRRKAWVGLRCSNNLVCLVGAHIMMKIYL